MKPTTSAEIRQAFSEYFEELGHTQVPSAPLPIYDNPTLLFNNAGMNQFVDTFLGHEPRPYARAVTVQKCMRVQGKHNDLENVGPSPRHHTFFEMLGNFSFGDYFKSAAIRYAFDFMTRVCLVPAERLWFTVHQEDDDAYRIWIDEIGAPAERVLRMGDKTNFWMMGEVGPCGPTSEIHFDWGPGHCSCGEPDCSVFLDNGCDRWLEVWNLVFLQYNQAADGSREPLPKPGVDTGMGLERIASVVQNQPVNYETDLFAPTMGLLQEMLGHSQAEREAHTVGYRVIADHGRAATFLLADGVLPGNTGRGYVLRMIIRRAARFGRLVGFDSPFLARVAHGYILQMREVYPELERHHKHIEQSLKQEEARFGRTVDGALSQLDAVLGQLDANGLKSVPGDVAFGLYATHGLPLEITRDVAAERGYSVDGAGYRVARAAHVEASGAGAFGQYETGANVYAETLAELIRAGRLEAEGVDYDPYSGPQMESVLLAILRDGQPTAEASAGEEVEFITAATPFYVEAGGEVSDTGLIRALDGAGALRVDAVRRPVAGLVVHAGQLDSGRLAAGERVSLEVDGVRRWDIRRNHTATHLLHRELRRTLGEQVTQQGSLVAPDRLRFDFSYAGAVGREKLAEIETAINLAVLENRPVRVAFMAQKEAIAAGAMALFGEKYGEVVRTVRVENGAEAVSFELCGGLHVDATGEIGLFRFTAEEAVGAGLRRVEAVTGRGALAMLQERLDVLDHIGDLLNAGPEEAAGRVELLIADRRGLERELARLRQARAGREFERLLAEVQSVDGVPVLAGQVEAADMDALRQLADRFRSQVPSGVAVLGSVQAGRPLLLVAVTEDLVGRGLKAGDLVAELARIVGGGGGGRPTLAQAGGKDPAKLPDAIAAAPDLVRRALDA